MKILLVFLALFQPIHSEESERLASFIVRVQPKAIYYARPLANQIFIQAKNHSLDPTVLAAMVWTESWFDRNARGSDYERGLWQLYPKASSLGLFWETVRAGRIVERGWDRPWFKLPIRARQNISRDVELGTILAAKMVQVFVKYCRAKHKDHRRPTDPYAHYNSGFRWPRIGYSLKLWKRTKIVRRVIGRLSITEGERRWVERRVSR